MYRFPNTFTSDKRADKTCRKHINNNLLRMVNRHICKAYDKNRKRVEITGEEAGRFFPEKYLFLSHDDVNYRIINDKFLTLRAILNDKEDITPELLLEYVIARMCEREDHYTKCAVIDALVNVVENDHLKIKIREMYDRYEMSDKNVLLYETGKSHLDPSESLNGWNNSTDKEMSVYHNNIRLMIKEMLDKVNKKKGKNIYKKNEAMRLLTMIEDGIIDIDFSGSALMENETEECNFAFNMYVKMFGHPCVYKLPDKDRSYVIEKFKEQAIEVLDEMKAEGEDIDELKTDEFVDEYIEERLEEVEDTRTYEGSDCIFWDTDYALIDEMGVDDAIEFVSDVMGDGPSVGGIRF